MAAKNIVHTLIKNFIRQCIPIDVVETLQTVHLVEC